MSKIKAHVAISLDGYIAHTDGETGWIPGELAKEISEIHQTSEILLAGFNTYEAIFEQCAGIWPYKNTYVISHHDFSALANKNLQFLLNDQFEQISALKKETAGDISVIGGGNLITFLLNNGLLDELNLYIVPVLLGDGIRFLGKSFDVNVKCEKSEEYKGVTKIRYTLN
ncbi:MAG: dihydrofolate reductase family protein [Dysgonomonas sp.]|nr:dihydrofolate reductase family protein [Dysgonomonas sp.]